MRVESTPSQFSGTVTASRAPLLVPTIGAADVMLFVLSPEVAFMMLPLHSAPYYERSLGSRSSRVALCLGRS